MDGYILVDKPAHMTSFGVVARVRRSLTQHAGRKVKVGHTGTLDPFATGLMILVVGKACRSAESFSKLDKTYEAVIRLGARSTTADPEGEILPVSSDQPRQGDIEQSMNKFRGSIAQRPPMYSAIKIDGVRAYDRARRGEDLEMPVRQVEVYSLEMMRYEYPELEIKTHVSSGTYIRSLASDIGDDLGVGAYCTGLRRTTVGRWDISQAHPLADQPWYDKILPV